MRATLYILLPICFVLTLFLVSQGVLQNLTDYRRPRQLADGAASRSAQGPAASQIAIKQLGTNGGGFFNANSAHPFENPTPLTNFVEMLAIFVISGCALLHVRQDGRRHPPGLGAAGGDDAHLPGDAVVAGAVEQGGNPLLTQLGVDQVATDIQAGGNMEGKEIRFGIATRRCGPSPRPRPRTARSTRCTTVDADRRADPDAATSSSARSSSAASAPGLYGMLIFAILAVFIAGLMVGRTPEYLGKKIEAFEMKMAMLAVLVLRWLCSWLHRRGSVWRLGHRRRQ